MIGLNNLHLEEQNSLEDIILDNYVALFRHIIGDKKLVVLNKERPKKPKELCELWRRELRTCKLCKTITFHPRHYAQIYCGDRIKRQGCAYIKGQEGCKRGMEKRWGILNKRRWENKQK